MDNTSSERPAERKVPLPNNLIRVPTSLDTDFFKWWCTFLRPFVKLTDKEIDVVSSLLKQRWEMSKIISDPSTLDRQLMESSTREKIIEECHITQAHYYVIMSSLRKNRVIINNCINPKLIPNIKEENGNFTFQLLILFKEETRR